VVFEIADYACVLSFSKNKMADPKWRFEILPSFSILMKFSNGAAFRSLITNFVLRVVFQKKKKWRIQNGDYNVQSFS
jgi:hypothetical protein